MDPPAETVRICQNCGAELLGDHCYRCGQPIRGLVRHFSSIVGDFLDTVLNIDGRFFATVPPLFLRPGFLSTEYFAGRRVRYVSPVRLFFFLCVVTFFVAQFRIDLDGQDPVVTMQPDTGVSVTAGDSGSIASAATEEDVERLRAAAIARLDERIAELRDGPGAMAAQFGLEAGKSAIEQEAAERLAVLRGEAAPPGSDTEVADSASGEEKLGGPGVIMFNDRPWDLSENPVQVSWLSEGGNAWLNRQIARGQQNIQRVKKDPNLLKDAFLSSVPATLFLMLPIFALMLKVLYLFKRRLYMEHLIVALHSHAFLCGAMLVILILQTLGELAAGLPWLATGLRWSETAVLLWMPLYLLLAQKRVYGQGWIMTLIKYGVIGTLYFIMVSFGALAALMASFVWL